MKIPKHLLIPGITEEKKAFIEKWIERKRRNLKRYPSFNTEEEAIKEAVRMEKENPLEFMSVWKEPEDVGNKYAVFEFGRREDAHNAGYTERVGDEKIYELAKRGVDEIEEL